MSPLGAEGGREVVRCHTSLAGRLPKLSYQPRSLPLEKQWIALRKNNCSVQLGHLFKLFIWKSLETHKKLQKWYIEVLCAHYPGSPNGDICALSRPGSSWSQYDYAIDCTRFHLFFLHALIFLLVSVHRSLTPLFFNLIKKPILRLRIWKARDNVTTPSPTILPNFAPPSQKSVDRLYTPSNP